MTRVRDERRFKIARISHHFTLWLIQSGLHAPEGKADLGGSHIQLPSVCRDLPSDCFVVAVNFAQDQACWIVVLASETFDSVDKGDMVPLLPDAEFEIVAALNVERLPEPKPIG